MARSKPAAPLREYTPTPARVRYGRMLWMFFMFFQLQGCLGVNFLLLTMLVGTSSLAMLALARGRHNKALTAAENLRYAIATGQQRSIEISLRKELALVEAGEAVSIEREWLARAQLGGLLVAEWRLDEAEQIYRTKETRLSPHLQALASFGRHELSLLNEHADDSHLQEIREDRDRCLAQVPIRYRTMVGDAWHALEGLCLMRMGQHRAAIPLLKTGLDSLAYNPARIVYLYHLGQAYERVGDQELAASTYEKATQAFPGSRLASEAKARTLALSSGSEGFFRGMLPEAPHLTVSSHSTDQDEAEKPSKDLDPPHDEDLE